LKLFLKLFETLFGKREIVSKVSTVSEFQ